LVIYTTVSFSCWWYLCQETVRLCGSRRFITVITSHRTNHNSIITSIPWTTDGWDLRYDASWPVVHRDQSPATSQRTDSLLIPSSYNLHYAMLHAVQEYRSAARCLLRRRNGINSRRHINYIACTFINVVHLWYLNSKTEVQTISQNWIDVTLIACYTFRFFWKSIIRQRKNT